MSLDSFSYHLGSLGGLHKYQKNWGKTGTFGPPDDAKIAYKETKGPKIIRVLLMNIVW